MFYKKEFVSFQMNDYVNWYIAKDKYKKYLAFSACLE